MRKLAKPILLLAILATSAGLLSACGEEDRSNLVPGDSAAEIESNIEVVESLVEDGQCLEALEEADAVQQQVESLPRTVDADLRRTLLDGAVTLIQLVRDNCEESGIDPDEEVDVIEPEPEVTPDEETESPGSGDETGTTGTTGRPEETPDPPNRPTPEPNPNPNPPVTPEVPEEPAEPVDPGPGSGGVTPNQ